MSQAGKYTKPIPFRDFGRYCKKHWGALLVVSDIFPQFSKMLQTKELYAKYKNRFEGLKIAVTVVETVEDLLKPEGELFFHIKPCYYNTLRHLIKTIIDAQTNDNEQIWAPDSNVIKRKVLFQIGFEITRYAHTVKKDVNIVKKYRFALDKLNSLLYALPGTKE